MMMGATKGLGVLSTIPALALLTVSFFVMVVLQKIEEGALKSFGRILVALLCILALLLFAGGLYAVSTGNCSVVKKIGKYSMKGSMPYYHGMNKPWKCLKK